MKDLKHLIYFEHLLDEAANELVMQAVSEGKHAVGYTCYHMPEVLLNLDNCFSVRMRAPRTGSLEISTYYMTNYLCGYAKALVERGIEGGYNFLSALAGGETCTEMNRTLEHFEILQLVKNENFFVSFIDVPFKVTPHGLEHYKNQITKKVLEPLHERYGTDISDASIRKAVAEHNEVCRIITEIGDMRKLANPPITGYEFHVLCLVSYCCPKALIIDKLRETLEEVKTRVPDAKPAHRARVVVVGSEVDDLDFTRTVEQSGASSLPTASASAPSPAGRRSFSATPSLRSTRSAAFIRKRASVRAICRRIRSTAGTILSISLQRNTMPRALSTSR